MYFIINISFSVLQSIYFDLCTVLQYQVTLEALRSWKRYSQMVAAAAATASGAHASAPAGCSTPAAVQDSAGCSTQEQGQAHHMAASAAGLRYPPEAVAQAPRSRQQVPLWHQQQCQGHGTEGRRASGEHEGGASVEREGGPLEERPTKRPCLSPGHGKEHDGEGREDQDQGLGLGFRDQGQGQGLEFRDQGQGLGLREGLGLRDQGLGLRDQGLGAAGVAVPVPVGHLHGTRSSMHGAGGEGSRDGSMHAPGGEGVVSAEVCDTVGAVCVSADGRVAASVSSGGAALKMEGRVGEAAVYGAGCWAANSTGRGM